MVSSRSTSSRPAPSPRRAEAGYNLVMLVMAITVLNILVAVALPMWSQRIRRDKEEEAIFRGLQYAEAIRVFQQRFGRYPASLEELVEVEPRSIRRLWEDPLSEHGEFGLVVEAPRNPEGRGAQADGSTAGDAASQGEGLEVRMQRLERPSLGAVGGTVSLIKLPRGEDADGRQAVEGAAIHGVYIDHEGESIRLFLDRDRYERWAFTTEMIPLPQTAGPERPVPRVRSDWIGKPFPEGLKPNLPVGAAAGGADRGAEVGGGSPPSGDGAARKEGRPREPVARPRDERGDERDRSEERLDRLRERLRGASRFRRRP